MSPRQKLNEEIAEKLEEMHTESPDKGYRRLRDDQGLNQPLNTAIMAVPDRRVILSI